MQLFIASTLSFSALARAQQNLGDVIDQGGKKLAPDELQSRLIGGTFEYRVPNGNFRLQPQSDGTLNGAYAGSQGRQYPATGKWSVNQSGQFCFTFSYAVMATPYEQKRCGFWFQLGDDHWVSASDSNRAAPVFLYKISR